MSASKRSGLTKEERQTSLPLQIKTTTQFFFLKKLNQQTSLKSLNLE
jgi:hypothetical protein